MYFLNTTSHIHDSDTLRLVGRCNLMSKLAYCSRTEGSYICDPPPRNELYVPDGHFNVFIFPENTFYAIYNGENHFQIRGLVAELHVFKYGGTTFGTFEKNLL